MYRIGERRKNRRRQAVKTGLIVCGVLLAVFGMYSILRQFLQPDSVLKQSAAVTTSVDFKKATQKFDEPNFTIEIPSGWKQVPQQSGLYKTYAWQSNNMVTDGQLIEVYEDTIPVNYAVNRVLVVTGDGPNLSLGGTVSDNCLTFTQNNIGPTTSLGTPARWQGVSFWCDQHNTQRDVVGTSSSEAVNTVTLTSDSGKGTHKYFFTYTNHAINADYTVFYNALNSFKFK